MKLQLLSFSEFSTLHMCTYPSWSKEQCEKPFKPDRYDMHRKHYAKPVASIYTINKKYGYQLLA
jgi:hypothetical protein